MSTPLKIILIICTVSMSCFSTAENITTISSHCKSGEYPYLNANMAELHYPRYETDEERKTKPGWILKRTGKFLSICADRQAEPFGSVVYRYGKIGEIEFEKVATKSSPFYVFERADSPHTGDNVFFFKAGPYTYCVSEATAMGSGISLTVLKAGKEIVSLFSGNDRGIDYEAGLLDISFGPSKSPALKEYPQANQFKTPCDGKRLMRP
jgi:hypothetical protein